MLLNNFNNRVGTMNLFLVILCVLCGNVGGAMSYKAGAVHSAQDVLTLIHEAGTKELDILVVPEIKGSENNYEETVKDLSKAAVAANAYVIAHLKDRARCQNKMEVIRSNLVFNRRGSVVADYRKPVNQVANCTATTNALTSFTTNFGVTFALMMAEDLVTKQELGEVENVVVAGEMGADLEVYGAPQFFASWAHVNKVNLISSDGIYPVNGLNDSGIIVAEIEKGSGEHATLSLIPSSNAPTEDLSLFTIRPLDVETSFKGYTELVCNNGMCCEFYVKTLTELKSEANYGLAAFNGVRHYGNNQYIGEQVCGVFACATSHDRSCDYRSSNNLITFEKLTISANFSSQTQYPIVLAEKLTADSFQQQTTSTGAVKLETVTLTDVKHLSIFGIYGREFESDYKSLQILNVDGVGLYEYIYNEDVQEFFDYLWIRVRILMFVVSIYVLEMM